MSSIPRPSTRIRPGKSCSRQSVGLLARRDVAIDSITYIGKESNRLEEVEEQSLTDASDVYTEYRDPRRDDWVTKVLPMLKAMPMRELMELSGMSRAALKAIRAGRRPHEGNAVRLTQIVKSARSK